MQKRGIMDALTEVVNDLTEMAKSAKEIDKGTMKLIVKGLLGTLAAGTILGGLASFVISMAGLGAVLLPLLPTLLSVEAAVVAGSVAFGALVFALDDVMPKIKMKMKDIGEAILKDILSVFHIDYETEADRRDALYQKLDTMIRGDEEAKQSRVLLEVKMPPQMSVGREPAVIQEQSFFLGDAYELA